MIPLLVGAGVVALGAIAIKLDREVQQLIHCPIFDCLTRQGVERRYRAMRPKNMSIIFLDIDKMHDANELYGYAGVNERIKASLAVRKTVRHGDRIAGRWMSGDEIVLCVPSDAAVAIAQRLQAAFLSNGLSATFGVAPATGDLETSVKAASDLVQAAKARGDRGSINI